MTRVLPAPFGQPAAMETMGTIAAPLLAGFAFASLGLVLQAQTSLRWPDQALLLTVSAAMLFIASIEATFNARRHFVPPGEWGAWLDLAPTAVRRSALQRAWLDGLASYNRWTEVSRLTYNLAIVALLAATAVVLVPHGALGVWRMAAVTVPSLGAAGELAWTVFAQRSRRRRQITVRYDDEPTQQSGPRLPQLRPYHPGDNTDIGR